MSENTPKFRRRMRHQFVGSSFNAVFQDSRLHDVWWQADTLVDEINMRCQLGDDVKMTKSELLRVVGKEYHDKSTEGNIFVSACDDKQLKLFRHDFKTTRDTEGKQLKYDFFQVTAKVCPESYPTVSNSVAWKEQNASKVLPPRTRQHVDFTSSQHFPDEATGVTNYKRRKFGTCHDGGSESHIIEERGSSSSDVFLSVMTTAEEEARPLPALCLLTYWESGDSRKLFAPKSLYGLECDVKKIVLDRIEKLEKVNRVAADWRALVDGCDRDDLCSEQDIFLIRHRSMYLACALRKFVDEVSDKSRWTWQQCIEYSVASMNDIGLETYTHWRPLAKWHRRLAYSQKGTFCKSPAPKLGCLRSSLRIQMQ